MPLNGGQEWGWDRDSVAKWMCHLATFGRGLSKVSCDIFKASLKKILPREALKNLYSLLNFKMSRHTGGTGQRRVPPNVTWGKGKRGGLKQPQKSVTYYLKDLKALQSGSIFCMSKLFNHYFPIVFTQRFHPDSVEWRNISGYRRNEYAIVVFLWKQIKENKQTLKWLKD